MIFTLVGFVALLTVAFFGGDISRLALLRFRLARLIVMALCAKTLIVGAPTHGVGWLLAAVHDFAYVAMLAFFWLNRKIPGVLLIFAGTLTNGITIALNGGRLPALPSALKKSGLQIDYSYFTNTGLVENPKLAFLGDVFYIPANWPMSNVFSIGDILIAAGTAYCIVRVCGTRWNAPIVDFGRLGGFSHPSNSTRIPTLPAPVAAATGPTPTSLGSPKPLKRR